MTHDSADLLLDFHRWLWAKQALYVLFINVVNDTTINLSQYLVASIWGYDESCQERCIPIISNINSDQVV